jgi:hypothetical protein
MMSASWLQRSLIGAAACIVASGCGGDNFSLRVPNKPPAITKDSLRWAPNHQLISPGVKYTFSVTARDPDFGDSIARFYWKFMDSDGIVLAAKDTDGPSVEHEFTQSIPESDNMFFALSVYAVDQKGAVGAEEIFALPMGPSAEPVPAVEIINYSPNEVIAKPLKIGAKPTGQDVHVGCKISNVAALAASTIVHCQLSIVNFSGFAIGPNNK